jgi:hypothetical protein
MSKAVTSLTLGEVLGAGRLSHGLPSRGLPLRSCRVFVRYFVWCIGRPTNKLASFNYWLPPAKNRGYAKLVKNSLR